MAEEKVGLPKWALALIITMALGLVGTITSLVIYIHERDVTALQENTKAVQELNITVTELNGSINQVRIEFSSTDKLLLDRIEALEKKAGR